MKRIIPVILAMASAFYSGCENKQEIKLNINPSSPLAHELFQVTGENFYFVDTDNRTDSDGDGDAANDKDLGFGAWGWHTTPGIYVFRAQDSRYPQQYPGRDFSVRKTTRPALDKTVVIRHTDKVTYFLNDLPKDCIVLSDAANPANTDWQTYIFPYLTTQTQQQITGFENDPSATLGTIVQRIANKDGLWYKINLTNATSMVGVTDTNNSGSPDYVPHLRMTQESLNEIVEQSFHKQNLDQGRNTILSAKPSNLINDPIPDGVCPLPNGNVVCDYVFDWTINGKQVTMGVVYGTGRLSDLDKAIINQYTTDSYYQLPGKPAAYRNPNILIVPKDSRAWEIRKTMAQAIQNHETNNP
jgi:hypothetical protein